MMALTSRHARTARMRWGRVRANPDLAHGATYNDKGDAPAASITDRVTVQAY
jgi:hypothetical protein